VQCLDCFALYLNPCYSEYGFKVLFAEAGCSYGSTVNHTNQQVEWLRSRGLLQSDTCLLDAGCYEGSFLAQLPESLTRIGVDIDGPAISRGRATYGKKGIEFICGNFENFRCDQRLDTITMFHVLEHLPSPVEVLRHLRSISHPKTRLVIEVPVIENGITNDINGFFAVLHTTHFSRASFKNCLGRAGWEMTDSEEQQDYNGLRVIAVPGETRAPVIDRHAMSALRLYLANWNLAIKAVEDRLPPVDDASTYVIWGAGAHTEFLYQTTSFFLSEPDREYVIVDSDPMKCGKSWRGIEISRPDVLSKVDWANRYLLVSSYGSAPAITRAAEKLGVPSNRIIELYKEFKVY